MAPAPLWDRIRVRDLKVQFRMNELIFPQDFKCKAAVVKVSGGEEGDVGTSDDKEGS